MPYIDPVSLRDVTVEHYDEEELRGFSFESSSQRWLLLIDNVDILVPRSLWPYLPGGKGL